jgi:hypothetical protein
MLIASPLAAEPAPVTKPVPAKPAAERPQPNLLASADVRVGETVAKVDPAAAPKPHRNARVTTCRCADVGTPQN